MIILFYKIRVATKKHRIVEDNLKELGKFKKECDFYPRASVKKANPLLS